MDHMILGPLLLSSRTIYQLHERIDKGKPDMGKIL